MCNVCLHYFISAVLLHKPLSLFPLPCALVIMAGLFVPSGPGVAAVPEYSVWSVDSSGVVQEPLVRQRKRKLDLSRMPCAKRDKGAVDVMLLAGDYEETSTTGTSTLWSAQVVASHDPALKYLDLYEVSPSAPLFPMRLYVRLCGGDGVSEVFYDGEAPFDLVVDKGKIALTCPSVGRSWRKV